MKVKLNPGVFELENLTINHMQPEPTNLAAAPRCGARTRSGLACRSPAVRGRSRCRMHGGTNKGAPKGNRNGWVHGNRSAEAEEQLKTIRKLTGTVRALKKLRLGQSLSEIELRHLLDQAGKLHREVPQ